MSFDISKVKAELENFISSASNDVIKDELEERLKLVNMINSEYRNYATLKAWMVVRNPVEMVTLDGIDEYRLTREMKYVLRDIVKDLYRLHFYGLAHGSLSSETVIVATCVEHMVGRPSKAVLVTFPINTRDATTSKDFQDLICLIEEILNGFSTPKDVKHLIDILRLEVRQASSKNRIFEGDRVVMYHPCFWTPAEFVTFVDKMYAECNGARARRLIFAGHGSNYLEHPAERVIILSKDVRFNYNQGINESIFGKVYDNELSLPEENRADKFFLFIRATMDHGFEKVGFSAPGNTSHSWIEEVERKLFCLAPDFMSNFVQRTFSRFKNAVFDCSLY